MNSDLLRQRRNLILISSVLIVFDFAKVSITKISVLGTELLIGDAQVLMTFVWIVWVYAFLRYYQYLRAEGDLKILAVFKGGVTAKVNAYVFRQLKKDSIAGTIAHSRVGFRWKYSILEYAPARGADKEISSGDLPLHKMIWWAIGSGFNVAIHTPKATDHILPLLLAIAAPLVKLIN